VNKTGDAYRELFERSADAILIIEGDKFIECNDATVKMLRYASRQELLETHPSELSPPRQPDGRDSFEKANEMMSIAFERGWHRFEWAHKRADGEVFPVEVLLTAVQDGARQVLHVVWRDITQRKFLEDQLRHQQKMDAVGQLAGGIAHDFNNLLVAIIGHADILRLKLADQPDTLKHVKPILGAGTRAADLVKQLLSFSRKQPTAPRTLDLGELVDGLRDLLEQLTGEHIALSTIRGKAPTLVWADRGQLEQVVMNLTSNARDAMEGGGELVIETSCVEISGSDIGNMTKLAPGHYVLLMVSDTGQGMDDDIRAHIFDPFFTTKELGSGTGLGLATVYGIVQQGGGDIAVSSAPGSGTVVRVYLPRASGKAAPLSQRTEPSELVGGDETILVVEDDLLVSALVVRTLTMLGYQVLCASDGVEALELLAQHADSIAMILSDVVMPKMGGPELEAELSERGTEKPVLFMSGYNENARLGFDGEQQPNFLRKPFTMSQLAESVRAVLDNARSATPSS
jgi:PAS domain S-box-containing protein